MAAWFDSQDYVKRYSPFGVMENMQGVNQANALMDLSGGITPLGTWVSYNSLLARQHSWLTSSTSTAHSHLWRRASLSRIYLYYMTRPSRRLDAPRHDSKQVSL